MLPVLAPGLSAADLAIPASPAAAPNRRDHVVTVRRRIDQSDPLANCFRTRRTCAPTRLRPEHGTITDNPRGRHLPRAGWLYRGEGRQSARPMPPSVMANAWWPDAFRLQPVNGQMSHPWVRRGFSARRWGRCRINWNGAGVDSGTAERSRRRSPTPRSRRYPPASVCRPRHAVRGANVYYARSVAPSPADRMRRSPSRRAHRGAAGPPTPRPAARRLLAGKGRSTPSSSRCLPDRRVYGQLRPVTLFAAPIVDMGDRRAYRRTRLPSPP